MLLSATLATTWKMMINIFFFWLIMQYKLYDVNVQLWVPATGNMTRKCYKGSRKIN